MSFKGRGRLLGTSRPAAGAAAAAARGGCAGAMRGPCKGRAARIAPPGNLHRPAWPGAWAGMQGAWPLVDAGHASSVDLDRTAPPAALFARPPGAGVFRMAAPRRNALIGLHRRGRCPGKRRREGRGITPAIARPTRGRCRSHAGRRSLVLSCAVHPVHGAEVDHAVAAAPARGDYPIHIPAVLRPLAILAPFYEGVKRIHAALGRASRARRGCGLLPDVTQLIAIISHAG